MAKVAVMTKNRICILMPYAGSWPNYLPLYLKSCQNNPSIDFLFFTDLEPPSSLPANVRFVRLSLQEFRSLARAKLGFEICCQRGYKLCDFRPAFGLIFADHLRPYDFWGHSDLDVVYGDIRHFVPDDLLRHHDVISVRREWISGPFSLYRNVSEVNQLFREEPAHRSIMQSETYGNFDESGHQWGLYLQTRNLLREPNLEPSMTRVVLKAAEQGRIRAHFKTMVKEQLQAGDSIRVDANHVFGGQTEYLFYHLIFDKRRRMFQFPDWDEVPERYLIRATGLYRHGEHRGLRYLSESLRRRWRALPRRRAA